MILHYIPNHELRQHWDFVKNGLEIVRSKADSSWIVEDVYCDCYENRSMLFLIITNKTLYGFVVLQPNNQAMHVWVTWMNINDNKLLDNIFEEVKVMSKQNGKSTITFTSQRKGWERKAKQMGFTPLTWEFKI
jgi:hypothetical protein